MRVSSTFCVDFRTSPCGFLENIPSGPAPAPRSRGGQRPPDPPAPGPYIAGGGAASSSSCCRLRRGGARRGGGAQSQLPAGQGVARALDSPLPPSLVLLPLLHDSRQVRPQASLWQPRRDVTAALPGAPPGRGGRRPRLCGKRGGAACRGFWQGVPEGGGEWKPCSSNWGEALPFSSLKVQYKVI